MSWLKVNLNKCVLFPLKDSNLSEINGIMVKEKITYLGVFYKDNKDKKLCSLSNFGPIIEQITKTFNT